MDDIPTLNHRRSIRLKEYDYAQPGAYFVTIVSYQRKILFGQIIAGKMMLNQVGEIVDQTWLDIPKHFPNSCCDNYVIMPNHIHGIIEIFDGPYVNHTQDTNEIIYNGPVGARHASPQPNQIHNINPIINDELVGATHESPLPLTQSGPKPKSIGAIIGQFKATVSKQLHQSGVLTQKKIWQRNYYEHIIRDEDDYQQIAEYIELNPINWEYDNENPTNL
jgi:REP element-mobilizing transposase RayT